VEVERRGPGPCALHGDVFKMEAHQLADARRTVDMWNDLEQEVGSGELPRFGRGVESAMLVAHGACRDADRAVVQGADQRVDLDGELRLRQFLGKAPQFTSSGNRRMIVEKHLMGKAADLTLVGNRNDLTAFGVVAEPSR